MSPALAGRFFTTEPPGKPHNLLLLFTYFFFWTAAFTVVSKSYQYHDAKLWTFWLLVSYSETWTVIQCDVGPKLDHILLVSYHCGHPGPSSIFTLSSSPVPSQNHSKHPSPAQSSVLSPSTKPPLPPWHTSSSPSSEHALRSLCVLLELHCCYPAPSLPPSEGHVSPPRAGQWS